MQNTKGFTEEQLKKELEFELHKHMKEKIDGVLNWIANPAIDAEHIKQLSEKLGVSEEELGNAIKKEYLQILSEVQFRGFGYMLYALRESYELRNNLKTYRHLLTYAENYKNIQIAKLQGETGEEIAKKFILKSSFDPMIR